MNARLFVVVTMLALAACAPLNGTQKALLEVDAGVPLGSSKVPACAVDYSEYNLGAHVLAFEIIDRKGVSFGFDLLQGFFQLLGLNISAEKGQMVMSMALAPSLAKNQPIANAMGRGQAKKSEFKFKLDAVKLSGEFGYYRSTPLSTLAERTLRDALNNTVNQIGIAQAAWKSKVVYIDGVDAVMPVGHAAGIQVGDRFSLYNVDLLWAGRPCDSDLLTERKTTSQPLAEGVAVQVEGHATILRLTAAPAAARLLPGARVEVSKLVGDQPRRLGRPIRLGEVKSEPLSIVNGQSVNLTLYIAEHLKSLLGDYGFVLRQ